MAGVFGGAGVAVAREVDEVPLVVDEEVVYELGFAGFDAGFGKVFVAGEHVDEGGFANIATSDKGVFGEIGVGAFAIVAVADDEGCFLYFHGTDGVWVWERNGREGLVLVGVVFMRTVFLETVG